MKHLKTLLLSACLIWSGSALTAQIPAKVKPAGVIPAQMVNINSNSVDELTRLNGVGESKAKAIIEYRKKNGDFKNIADLDKVKGIGSSIIEKNKSLIQLKNSVIKKAK